MNNCVYPCEFLEHVIFSLSILLTSKMVNYVSVVILLVCDWVCAWGMHRKLVYFFQNKWIRSRCYFSTCRRIMKIIFFSQAKNMESLLRVDMNIAYKGSVSGIVLQDINRFREFFSSLCIFQSPSFSTLDSRLSILEPRFSHLKTRTSRPSKRENRVSRIESRLSTYLWAVL